MEWVEIIFYIIGLFIGGVIVGYFGWKGMFLIGVISICCIFIQLLIPFKESFANDTKGENK